MNQSTQNLLIVLLLLGALMSFSRPTAGVLGQIATVSVTMIFSVFQAFIAIAASSVFGLLFILILFYALTNGGFKGNSAIWILALIFIIALVI